MFRAMFPPRIRLAVNRQHLGGSLGLPGTFVNSFGRHPHFAPDRYRRRRQNPRRAHRARADAFPLSRRPVARYALSMARSDASIDPTTHTVPACLPMASSVIESAGVAFIAENRGGAGVRLMAPQRPSP